jgi:Mg2+-importing ATPase
MADVVLFSLNPDWSPYGLSEEAARAARERHGLNKSPAEQPLRPFAVLFAATLNPFNMLIAILAAISIGTGQTATFVIMIVMIFLSTGLRYGPSANILHRLFY